MKAHVKVPRFQALAARVEEGCTTPAAVVDDGRILDVTPGASRQGLDAGDLLEATTLPENVTSIPFDLDRLEAYQRNLTEAVRTRTPIAEPFGYGEVLAEVPDGSAPANLLEPPDLPEEFSICVGASPTAWLARILCLRLDPGEAEVVTNDQYAQVLDGVRSEEVWGLGTNFVSILNGRPLETIGDLRTLDPPQRRDLLGPIAESLDELVEGRDPRPLNPFSRPASLRHGFSTGTDDPKTIRSRLRSTLRTLAESLRDTAARAHRLRLTYSPGNQQPRVGTHDYSSATNDPQVLAFNGTSLLGNLKPLNEQGDLHVEVSCLVPSVTTYHTRVEEDPDDLSVRP